MGRQHWEANLGRRQRRGGVTTVALTAEGSFWPSRSREG